MSNLYLIGFMGSGKSSVGRRLAERLGRPFVDTDEEIARREGMDIPSLFAKGGELYFRDLEQAVLLDLAGRSGWVIATGGGIVLRVRNTEIMRNSGTTIFLFAREEVLLRRLTGSEAGRPLLGSAVDAAERIRQLLKERRGMYEWADLVVDTSDRTVDQVVDEIIRRLELPEAGGRNPEKTI